MKNEKGTAQIAVYVGKIWKGMDRLITTMKRIFKNTMKYFRNPGEDLTDALKITVEDLNVFGDDEDEQSVIVLSGDVVEEISDKRGVSHDVKFASFDEGDVYSLFHFKDSEWTLPGTLYMADDHESANVDEIGKAYDRLRVIVQRRNYNPGSGLIRDSQFYKGYVKRKRMWKKAKVQVVPVREEIFTRNRGIIETDAITNKAVFIVGLGSGGAPIAVELAKTSVMAFYIMDGDRLEVGNVVRHLAGLSDAGRRKTKFIKQMIREKNPYANVQTFEVEASWEIYDLLCEIIRKVDLVICATDTRESKRIINKACVQEKKPLIIAGVGRRAYCGQVLIIHPFETMCYQCFLQLVPDEDKGQSSFNVESVGQVAYSDRPVQIEPGLNNDIMPTSQLVVKLAIQEMMKGKNTTLRSLDEDLVAPWYFWLNRREKGTSFENLRPLGFERDDVHVMRWYGFNIPRDPTCTECGDWVGRMSAKEGIQITKEEAELFGKDED